ncbi:hypothetical protein [Alkalihalobacillus sp. LMS39]|uniref:hypothetical protein n=1 Tax=Alkalihalobacillus sp. LMS39 TaxID=2924032 RepID=UPI001FB3CD4B|nr:hypothetical protein [Alkalihalobacillus sp. LMS39]UOE92539.1 hypothetical protein MM271_14990 [Alkalihalobacillus sp. LMS39]
MQIYFSPEFLKEDAQVLNVVTDDNEAVGYLAFLMEEKKMYVYGQLQEGGVEADFKDLIKPYLEGLTKLKPDMEVYSFVSVGGSKIELENEEGKQ